MSLTNNSTSDAGIQEKIANGWVGVSLNSQQYVWIPNSSLGNWWISTTQGDNQITTSAGVFDFWDNGDWKIMYQSTAPGSQPQLLAQVHGIAPSITIVVASDGSISSPTN
jgi:hypothetical protein